MMTRFACASVVVVLVLLFSPKSFAQSGSQLPAGYDGDTVVMKAGTVYIGRIVDLVPDIEVSIITTFDEAHVLKMADVLRIGRRPRNEAGGSDRSLSSSSFRNRAFSEATVPSVYASGALLMSGSLSGVSLFSNVSTAAPSSAQSGGYTYIISGEVGIPLRNNKIVFLSADVGSGSFSVLSSGNDGSGTHRSYGIGLGYGFEAGGNFVTPSIQFRRLHKIFEVNNPFGPDGEFTENYSGLSFTTQIMFPITEVVGISFRSAISYMVSESEVQDGDGMAIELGVGVSWSTFLKALYR